MTILHVFSRRFCLILLCGLVGCNNADNEIRAGLMKDVDTTLTYDIVAKDIAKHIGKRVAWHGLHIGSDEAKQIEYYTFLPTKKNSGVDFEKPFMFNRADGKDTRSDSQKTIENDHRPLIIATVSGSGDFKYGDGGAVKKQIAAPVLKDVTIIAPGE